MAIKFEITKDCQQDISDLGLDVFRCLNLNYLIPIKNGSAVQIGKLHPTQKPVELMEYLVKTYTNEGNTVLDFTMGSGSTGVACVNRNFIGIELDQTYFSIAFNRIEEARVKSKKLFQ